VSRILVIDDEHLVRTLMVEILVAAGHETLAAETAERALALLDEDREFDLVVSDIVMPGLSGLELLETVRLRRASLPVLLVTRRGHVRHAERGTGPRRRRLADEAVHARQAAQRRRAGARAREPPPR